MSTVPATPAALANCTCIKCTRINGTRINGALVDRTQTLKDFVLPPGLNFPSFHILVNLNPRALYFEGFDRDAGLELVPFPAVDPVDRRTTYEFLYLENRPKALRDADAERVKKNLDAEGLKKARDQALNYYERNLLVRYARFQIALKVVANGGDRRMALDYLDYFTASDKAEAIYTRVKSFDTEREFMIETLAKTFMMRSPEPISEAKANLMALEQYHINFADEMARFTYALLEMVGFPRVVDVYSAPYESARTCHCNLRKLIDFYHAAVADYVDPIDHTSD